MAHLNFTVDSALLRELGEKLVETVHLAVSELVKNSYDADATMVMVEFRQGESGNEKIYISDDGVGMNFEEVKKYWMRIATSNKSLKNISQKYGRTKTGEKGIGRFCCRRLGSKLKLVTIGSQINGSTGGTELQKTEVDFHWEDFKPGTNVTEIECPGMQSIIEGGETGTTLIISGLKDQWTLKGYNWLKRQLAVLAANRGAKREGYKEDPGFNILLEAPNLEGGGVRDIREDMINAGWGTLTAHINRKHQAVCELEALGIGRKRVISNQTYSHLNDIKLKIGIMVDKRSHMRDTSVISKEKLKDILKDWGGVQIRRHGFRVYPYGDDDWLQIDHDRGLRRRIPVKELHKFAQSLSPHGVNPDRVLLNMLSMRNYVGEVEIGDKAEGFEMKVSREGFLSSSAVDELKDFTRFAIEWATIYREFYIRKKAKEEADAAKECLEEVTGEDIEEGKLVEVAVNHIKKEVDNIATFLPEPERKEFQKSVNNSFQLILKHEASNKEQLLHFRLIASTSTLLLVFSHEVKSLLGMLETGKNTLKRIGEKLPAQERNMIEKTAEEFLNMKKRFRELLDMTALIGVDGRRQKPQMLALRERIVQSVNILSLIVNKYNIKIDYQQVPNNITTKSILEAELYAILLNILSNSIKSVIAGGGTRMIEITAERVNKKTFIRFLDTGIGLDEHHYEDVFTPFISDPDGQMYSSLTDRLNPEDKYIVGTGSGLGLSIVLEIVKARNGEISFKKPQENWNNELEVILP